MSETSSALADAGERIQPLRRLLEGVLGVPATEGNEVTALRNGDQIFPAMLAAIAAAEQTIDLLTFIYWKGDVGTQFADALAERASAGVRVRVLLDGWGSHPIERDLLAKMERAGVSIRWFRPLHRLQKGTLNHRTHRKVLVVDEAIGFTGGVGISDLWKGDARNEHEWRDTHFHVRGPCVDGLRAAFLDNWVEAGGTIFEVGTDRFPEQPKVGTSVVQCIRGASGPGTSDVERLLRTLIEAAETSIRVATAYFVPDDDLLEALCEAGSRGVAIQILLPGRHADKQFVRVSGEAHFEALLDSGVELWNYEPSMMHAKVMTVDGIVSSIGSANFNARSTTCDEEINLVVLDTDLASTLDGHFEQDLERSAQVAAGHWKDRSLLQRAAESATAPVRRWF